MELPEIIKEFMQMIDDGLKFTVSNCKLAEKSVDSALTNGWESYAKGENVNTINANFNRFMNIHTAKEEIDKLLGLYALNYLIRNRTISLDTMGIELDTKVYYDKYSGENLKEERQAIIRDIVTIVVTNKVKDKFKLDKRVVNYIILNISKYVKEIIEG